MALRINKFLSNSLNVSRRFADKLIETEEIFLNGKRAVRGDDVSLDDEVVYKGKKLKLKNEKKIYLALNKPQGFITTMSDENGRKCVKDLVSDCKTRVYPIGRLDRNSEGLLLFTNDGDFANLMMHPSSHIPKTYRVTVKGKVTEKILDQLEKGIIIDDRKTLPAITFLNSYKKGISVVDITIFEGRNRQVRKMMKYFDFEVLTLERIKYGTIELKDIPRGKYIKLTKQQINELIDMASDGAK
ncbi:MAG: pseudouridine synthase [Clostridia bacterium]|nr:pseudouridine synthase [Clostridia bacterium]